MPTPAALAQSVIDPALTVEQVITGLDAPVGMAFVPGSSDLFIIEKNTGRVKLAQNNAVTRTLLDLPVANSSEQGLLGIAIHPRFSKNNLVYLYYTAANSDGGQAVANRIERYRFDGDELVFNKRIKNLPGGPGPNHDGGKIEFGPDGKLYAVIGDLNREERTQNFEDSTRTTRTGAVLRLESGGGSPADNPFFKRSNTGAKAALNDIFAYGVRNSFGLAFDPITNLLWDTENGPEGFDEINVIRPGFNSGWTDIMGPRSRNGGKTGTLVSLGPRAKYADPVFSWSSAIAPTDLAFNATDAIGDQYLNDLFAGDIHGSLYHFDLGANRRALTLSGDLADRVADNASNDLTAEQDSIIFGSGFGVITEIIPRSDGLYVLSPTHDAVFRIAPNDQSPGAVAVPEPALFTFPFLAALALRRRK